MGILTLRAGALRHRLALERATDTQAAGGQIARTWAGPMVWAEIRPLSGVEFAEADGQQASVTHEIRIRFRSGVDSGQRFRMGARVFEITAVRRLYERRREIVCSCIEKVA